LIEEMHNSIDNMNECVISEQNVGLIAESNRGSDNNVVHSSPSITSTTSTTHNNFNGQQLQQILTTNTTISSINTINQCNVHKNNNNNNFNISNNSSSPKLNLMAELFESEEEEDDNSEVESFTLDEEPVLDTSKFLLSAEASDNQIVTGIHLAETPEIDPESRANLEALLEAGIYQYMIDWRMPTIKY
jgi:hypothetical protein